MTLAELYTALEAVENGPELVKTVKAEITKILTQNIQVDENDGSYCFMVADAFRASLTTLLNRCSLVKYRQKAEAPTAR